MPAHLKRDQYKRGAWLCLWAYAVLIGYLSLRPSIEIGPQGADKLAHAAAYCVFALLAFAPANRTITHPRLCTLIAGYGIVLEFLQAPLPTRSFSLLDMLANFSGIVLCLLLLHLGKSSSLVRRNTVSPDRD